MFERRLKIVLAILVVVTVTLILRATQLQVVQHQDWNVKAAETLKRFQPVETSRGKIVDVRGRPVAVDEPCVDACVDYRAVMAPPDRVWLTEVARKRLVERLGAAYTKAGRDRIAEMRGQEIQQVEADIAAMWAKLALVSGQTPADINSIRDNIVRRVELRRRYIWYRNFELAKQKHAASTTQPESGWRRWLLDDEEDADAPRLETFAVTVGEQYEPHIILRNVSADVQNELGKYIERYPGLVLRPGTHRFYPYGEAGCHLIGHLSRVSREDRAKDPNVGVDELRQYLPNDLIGRTGIESLCERILRGSRGKIARLDEKEVERTAPLPGADVKLTIDIELQHQVQQMFRAVEFRDKHGVLEETIPMHGAAVVIDVPTGEVRALASYPDLNLNELDEKYEALSDKYSLEKPLLNRATQAQLEPGSTVKPIVGLGAIADGHITATTGIECTGFLVIKGKKYAVGRCWVASKFMKDLGKEGVKHHPVPSAAPHRGHDGNADGFLTYADALERSCNNYFENCADMLGMEGLSKWYDRFGLGRPTGIGIGEASGRLPSSFMKRAKYKADELQFNTWISGIGQGPVAATPIQMANVAATIARNGIWMRPRLVQGELPRASANPLPDRVDLKLPAEALRQAKEGMILVVNSRAGTGTQLRREDMVVAGKTGTAQAASLWTRLEDEEGKPILDENGRSRREKLEPSTKDAPNPRARWYHGAGEDGKGLNHAWFIGFAPAENPKVAFAVMVEYGVSGGATAGGVASRVLEACIEHGYLPVNHKAVAPAASAR